MKPIKPDLAHEPVPEELSSTWRLLDGLHRRDFAAEKAFVDKYLPDIWAQATGRLSARARSLNDTWDVVQDVIARFMVLAEKLHYARHGALRAYLRSMVRSEIINLEKATRRRKEEPETAEMEQVPAPGLTPAEEHERDGECEIAGRALKSLTEEERRAVLLRAQGLAPREIARRLGRPPGNTTRTFIRRSVEKGKAEYGRLLRTREQKPGGPR